ncbi:hypothetical protein [Sphingomonas jatrophae]|uniref:hypothetical protein n=1 Tax=Sphingomonas jatrophae TaxID=1166337 RepID=UPI002418A90C|nr:hypothetical protein [Sphingomonas jatrophae]
MAAMRRNSVIVDLAASSGSNVGGRAAGETVERHGVLMIDAADGVSRLEADAFNLFAPHVFDPTEACWDKDAEALRLSEWGTSRSMR